MKRIVIFCDGTWNALAAPNATHVARLARAVRPTASDGTTQLVYYQQGVGTGRGSNKLAKKADKLLGGAFGWGLDDNIIDVFRNLTFWYEPGDDIFIFGFSRGAYTARSLAGLIRTAGIPPRDHLSRIQDAMALYRQRGSDTKPDGAKSRRFRKLFSPLTATSEEDLAWRRQQGDTDSFFLRLAYVGVWDTVGALGLPGVFGVFSKLVNKKYAFHDAALSRSVRSARHVLAIDERRRMYPPAKWDNLDELNDVVTGAQRPYQQQWFPGVHSVAGGSGIVQPLSAYTAQWVVDGAIDRGLEFDKDSLRNIVGGKDAGVDAGATYQKAGIGNLGGLWLADRDGPGKLDQVADVTRERVRLRPDYRPGALSKVFDQL